MSSISEFFQMFKDSLCVNDWPIWTQKGAKRNVKIWTTIFYKTFWKKKCCTWTVGFKNSFSTYVFYELDGLFWLNLYQNISSISEMKPYSNGIDYLCLLWKWVILIVLNYNGQNVRILWVARSIEEYMADLILAR